MRSTHWRSIGEAVATLRHLPEVDHAQHDGQGRIQLVADDLDERPFDPVGFEKLGVGCLKLGQKRVLFDDQVVVLDGLAHDGEQELGLARLGEIPVHVALVDGVDHGAQIGIGSEQQPRGFGANRHRQAQDLDAAHAGHALV